MGCYVIAPGGASFGRAGVAAIFRKGDRIRLTIGSADTPATAAPLPALADSLGGEIRILHGGRYASHVLLPVASD